MVVTHEIKFAEDVSDRVVFIDDSLIIEQETFVIILQMQLEERTSKFLLIVE